VRRYLPLFILAALAVALLALNRAAADWRYLRAGPPGALLYAAAFDGFLDEWEQADGRNAHLAVDGRMQISIETPQQVVWSAALPRFADFDVATEAAAMDGPEDNGYGLIFRLSDDRRSFYLFLVSSNGYYKVERYLDGAAKALSNWIESPLVNTGMGARNRLRVVATGATFRFFINDQPVELCIPDDPLAESTYRGGLCMGGTMRDALTDASLADGRLGVVAITEIEQPGVVVGFDHLLVYSPQAP
jgi:hypothetical protein